MGVNGQNLSSRNAHHRALLLVSFQSLNPKTGKKNPHSILAMSDERDGDEIRRQGTTPAALEDVNLLHEILHRLPPQPSTLPRAGLVSKLWGGLPC